MMKMEQIVYGGPAKQILAIPDHYVALGFKHAKATAGTPGLAVLEDGKYMIKAGTVYPANDATAIGVVLNDYDVTQSDAMLAVVIHGFIKTAALPALPSANALAAMKQLTFNPVIDMGLVLTCTKADIAVGEAKDVEHTVNVYLTGATFRPAAATLTNWTFANEATTKVAVKSVVVSADKTYVTITTKNSAAAVAGSTTVVPKAAAISTGQVPTAAVAIATVA